MATTPDVQIPSKAVSAGADIREPVRELLEDLNLLGTPEDNEKAAGIAAAFTGPPQSVALIEAGATAAAKWWSAGFGATVIAAWTAVAGWYPDEPESVQVAMVGGGLVVTAAFVIAVGYLMASDVRGRAAAAVSIVGARVEVAKAMVQAAESVYEPTPSASAVEVVPLPSRVRVKNLRRPGDDEAGWHAVAMERHPDGNKYIVVKGSSEDTLPPSDLDFLE